MPRPTAAATVAFGCSALTSPAGAATLAKVPERGTLLLAIYEEMPPFHVAGNGIDVDLARTLAEAQREAAAALKRGEVMVAAGQASELESVLRGDTRFAIEPMPTPRAPREGWAAELAVKADATELAQALQAAVNQLAQSGKIAEILQRHNVSWRAA